MNILNEIFDAVYCINLDRRTDRWDTFKDTWITQLGTEVDRFSAWDAKTMGIPFDKGDYKEDESHSAGSVACSLSHCAVMREALNAGHDEVLIFEDDAVPINTETFLEEFERYYHALPPDYWFAYAGTYHRVGPIKINERIGRCIGATGMHCYMIKPKESAWIIGECLKHLKEYVQDELISVWHWISNKNFYSFEPMLVIQREGYSDLLMKDVDYGCVGTWATDDAPLAKAFGITRCDSGGTYTATQNPSEKVIVELVRNHLEGAPSHSIDNDMVEYLKRVLYPNRTQQ